MEWINVKDKQPENSGVYLAVACDEGCPAGEGIWYDTVVVCAEYAFGSWTWNYGCTEYDIGEIVTHWMPLPALPQ